MAWNKTTGIVGYMFLLLPEIVDNIFQPFLLYVMKGFEEGETGIVERRSSFYSQDIV